MFRKKRAVVALLALAFLVVGFYVTYFVASFWLFRPKVVVITNLSGHSATVVWVSRKKEPGFVLYSKSRFAKVLPYPFNMWLMSIAYDDRDLASAALRSAKKNPFSRPAKIKIKQAGSYYVHSVTLRNLDPDTPYYFKLGNGFLWYSSAERIISDPFENSDGFSLKTLKELDKLHKPNPSFGSVLDLDNNPVKDAVIVSYLTNTLDESSDTKAPISLYLSSAVTEEGTFYIDLANARSIESGEPVVAGDDSSVYQAVEVYTKDGLAVRKIVDLKHNAPFPDIRLPAAPAQALNFNVFAKAPVVDIDVLGLRKQEDSPNLRTLIANRRISNTQCYIGSKPYDIGSYAVAGNRCLKCVQNGQRAVFKIVDQKLCGIKHQFSGTHGGGRSPQSNVKPSRTPSLSKARLIRAECTLESGKPVVKIEYVNLNPAVVQYRVARKSGGVWNYWYAKVPASKKIVFVDKGVRLGETFVYSVQPLVDGKPMGPWSQTPQITCKRSASASSQASPAQSKKVQFRPVELISYGCKNGRVEIVFKDTNTGENGYTIARRVDGKAWSYRYAHKPKVPGVGSPVKYTDLNVSAGHTYEYSVHPDGAEISKFWRQTKPILCKPATTPIVTEKPSKQLDQVGVPEKKLKFPVVVQFKTSGVCPSYVAEQRVARSKPQLNGIVSEFLGFARKAKTDLMNKYGYVTTKSKSAKVCTVGVYVVKIKTGETERVYSVPLYKQIKEPDAYWQSLLKPLSKVDYLAEYADQLREFLGRYTRYRSTLVWVDKKEEVLIYPEGINRAIQERVVDDGRAVSLPLRTATGVRVVKACPLGRPRVRVYSLLTKKAIYLCDPTLTSEYRQYHPPDKVQLLYPASAYYVYPASDVCKGKGFWAKPISGEYKECHVYIGASNQWVKRYECKKGYEAKKEAGKYRCVKKAVEVPAKPGKTLTLFEALFTASAAEKYYTYASDGTLEFKAPGTYTLSFRGREYTVKIPDTGQAYKIFLDTNGNGKKDPSEKYLNDLVSISSIRIEPKTIEFEYTFEPGYNFVHFPFAFEDKSLTKASELLRYLRKHGKFSLVARYDGKWHTVDQFGVVGTSGYAQDSDFPIVPGVGYVIRNLSNRSIKVRFSGHMFSEPVPVYMFRGWNLVGFYSPSRTYTAKSLIDEINKTKQITVVNVSRWESGRYEGLQYEQKVYGFDFPIFWQQAYFVHVKSIADSSLRVYRWVER